MKTPDPANTARTSRLNVRIRPETEALLAETLLKCRLRKRDQGKVVDETLLAALSKDDRIFFVQLAAPNPEVTSTVESNCRRIQLLWNDLRLKLNEPRPIPRDNNEELIRWKRQVSEAEQLYGELRALLGEIRRSGAIQNISSSHLGALNKLWGDLNAAKAQNARAALYLEALEAVAPGLRELGHQPSSQPPAAPKP